jgi:hypothetical protein
MPARADGKLEEYGKVVRRRRVFLIRRVTIDPIGVTRSEE